MKILVPTDLSNLSKVAVIYAAKLSAACDAKLYILNVNYIDPPTRTLSEFTTGDILVAKRAQRESDLRKLLHEISAELNTELQAEILVQDGGNLSENIATTAREFGCDLIIMGTKGAGGLKKVFFGSNTASVIGKSVVPVLAIPEFAIFKGLSDIIYASDLRNTKEELEILLPMAKKFGSAIHLVHFYKEGSEPAQSSSEYSTQLRHDLNYERIESHFFLSASVKAGLDQFMNGRNVDMLAMFPARRNFFESLLEKSNTRKVVYESHVPLLTNNKGQAELF